jgi:very-short-patch-repair endonuclease
MKRYCKKCKRNITDDEYYFSNKNFGKALCRTHQPTLEVRRLGKKLKQIGNWDVIYEAFDGHKNVDISIPSAKVDIEVDGLHHAMTKTQALSDIKRTYYSYKNDGIITLHIPNILIRDDDTTDEAAKYINNFLSDNREDVKDNIIIKFLKRILK